MKQAEKLIIRCRIQLIRRQSKTLRRIEGQAKKRITSGSVYMASTDGNQARKPCRPRGSHRTAPHAFRSAAASYLTIRSELEFQELVAKLAHVAHIVPHIKVLAHIQDDLLSRGA